MCLEPSGRLEEPLSRIWRGRESTGRFSMRTVHPAGCDSRSAARIGSGRRKWGVHRSTSLMAVSRLIRWPIETNPGRTARRVLIEAKLAWVDEMRRSGDGMPADMPAADTLQLPMLLLSGSVSGRFLRARRGPVRWCQHLVNAMN